MKTKKYWYKFFVYYCPQCGQSHEWKERIYDKRKPKSPNKRRVIEEVWDYCGL